MLIAVRGREKIKLTTKMFLARLVAARTCLQAKKGANGGRGA